jgi:hypothetical protein
MLHIYTVIIHDDRFGTQEVARAFTQLEDAKSFIAQCKLVEPSSAYSYVIETVQLDGYPLEPY